MVAGIGSLMGLCPQPEQWTILSWCEPFHILPSQLSPEDWQWLKDYHDMRWLKAWYDRWQEVATQPYRKDGGYMSMPQDVAQYLLALSNEAEERWQISD